MNDQPMSPEEISKKLAEQHINFPTTLLDLDIALRRVGLSLRGANLKAQLAHDKAAAEIFADAIITFDVLTHVIQGRLAEISKQVQTDELSRFLWK